MSTCLRSCCLVVFSLCFHGNNKLQSTLDSSTLASNYPLWHFVSRLISAYVFYWCCISTACLTCRNKSIYRHVFLKDRRVKTQTAKSKPISRLVTYNTLYWSRIHDVQWSLFSAYDPSSLEEQRAATSRTQGADPDPDESSAVCLRAQAVYQPNTCFDDSRGTGTPRRKPHRHANSKQKGTPPSRELNPGPRCCERTVLTATPPRISHGSWIVDVDKSRLCGMFMDFFISLSLPLEHRHHKQLQSVSFWSHEASVD